MSKFYNEIEANLYKYYYLLKTEKNYQAVMKSIEQFDEELKQMFISDYPKEAIIKTYQELEESIIFSFRTLFVLENSSEAIIKGEEMISFLDANDKYLNSVFEGYSFDQNSKEYKEFRSTAEKNILAIIKSQ